jgi:signal-transduction protein with cAMP-binding, CBS, and nucleotidyltransferase domain
MSIGDQEVRALTKGPPVEVFAQWTLRGVAQALAGGPIGAVVVRGAHPPGAPGNCPEGVVSERDIVQAIAEGTEIDTTRAEDLMTFDLVSVAPNESVLAVATRMLDEEIRHVPVIKGDVVIGVLSERDILRALVADCQAGPTRA